MDQCSSRDALRAGFTTQTRCMSRRLSVNRILCARARNAIGTHELAGCPPQARGLEAGRQPEQLRAKSPEVRSRSVLGGGQDTVSASHLVSTKLGQPHPPPGELSQGSPCGRTPSLRHCRRFEGESLGHLQSREPAALHGWNAKIPFEEGFATRSLGTRERSRSPCERYEL